MQVSRSVVILTSVLVMALIATLAYQFGKSSNQSVVETEPGILAKSDLAVDSENSPLGQEITESSQLAQATSTRGEFSAQERQLVSEDREADETCRGSSDAAESEAACVRRDVTLTGLNEAGICWGKEGEAYAEHDYHRCGASSLR